MNNDGIRVKINGGYLVAARNEDPLSNGIVIYFMTDDGDSLDVVSVQANTSNIKVYCYENVYREYPTKKYTLKNSEIYKALYE